MPGDHRSPAARPEALAGLRGAVAALAFTVTVLAGVPASGAAPAVPALGLRERAASASQTPPGARLPVPEPSPDASRQEADDILSGAEFQEPPKTVPDRISEWIGEQINRVFTSGGFGAFAWIMLALLLGGVALLLTRIRWTRGLGRADRGFEFDLEDRRPPHEWLADAERFEARGEWKQAIRCRFRALVGSLIELGALRDLPGRTTGEYRIEIRRFAPAAAEPFNVATRLFEGAWYGDEPTGPGESATFRGAAEQAEREVRERARRGAEDAVGVST